MARPPFLKAGRWVRITWMDACRGDCDWTSLDEVDAPLVTVWTAGIVMQVDREKVVLGMNKTSNGNYCQLMTIPVAWLTKVEDLGVP